MISIWTQTTYRFSNYKLVHECFSKSFFKTTRMRKCHLGFTSEGSSFRVTVQGFNVSVCMVAYWGFSSNHRVLL